MANSHTSDPSAQRLRRGTRASERLRGVSFPLAVRGYDRRAVDEFLDELRDLVDDLEAHQTREGVVQKALDELGEETAGILQRAHETADEIAARSRAQADGRLQRAEREAELVKREADEYAGQVVADTKLLWEERQRLIEDIRHLADEVLATADDAMERLKLPEPLAAADLDAERTTSEAPITPRHPLSIAPSPPADEESDPSVPYDLEDPDATAPWALPRADEEDEEPDPDATALWSVESAGNEHDAGEEQPGAGEAEPEAGEEEPRDDLTRHWAAEGAQAREEPEAAQPAGEAGDGDDDHHTAELEALPGGNADEQAAERERDRD